MGIAKKKIDQAFEDHGRTYGGQKEDYFALLYLAEYWRREPDKIAGHVAFGGDDYGVDAFYIEREALSGV